MNENLSYCIVYTARYGLLDIYFYFQNTKRRIDKIMALLPPIGAESDPESSSDDEQEVLSRNLLKEFIEDPDDDDEENYTPEENREDAVELLPISVSKQRLAAATPSVVPPFSPLVQKNPNSSIKRKGKKDEPPFKWTTDDFEYEVTTAQTNDFTRPQNIKTPLQYFKTFFSPDIVELIVDQTNLYSTQTFHKCVDTSIDEMHDFLAIEILMGIVDMPAYTDYWAQETRYELIANIMPLKRYQAIRRSLHFVNNEELNDDRYFKVRPILDRVRRNCLTIESESRCSVDEMMIPYKGKKAGSRRQYMKNKPKKWGFKMFVRCGVSGIVYDFFPYGGNDTFRNHCFTEVENNMGFGAKCVLALCSTIQNKPLSMVYFDNYFTSLELITYLRSEFGILSLGTVRKDRLRDCPLESDKKLKKDGRGSFDQRVDNDSHIVVVKWYDNKSVTLCSSYVASNPMTTIQRFSKEENRKIHIPCPQLIKHYNSHMGGVDLADMLIAIYRIRFKTHRWYMSIFSQIIDISINNAWLLYKRDSNILQENPKTVIPLKQFRIKLAKSLLQADRVKRGRPSNEQLPLTSKKIKNPVKPRPQDDIRLDHLDHFPIYGAMGRCRNCKKGQTAIFCSKCNIRLCLVQNRNCFMDVHINK